MKAVLTSLLLLLIAQTHGIAQTPVKPIDEALQNITTLVRPGRVGYATVGDGNKYIQCRRLGDRSLRCEAAGTSLQPSLRSVLTGERLARLAALGWVLDPSFGNYTRSFPASVSTGDVAAQISKTLTEAYAADAAELEISTAWVADIPCPPRNGPTQNLAGMVNDAPAMRATSLRGCSYVPPPQDAQHFGSAAELIAQYGPTATAEVQRLRINATRRVHVVFNAGIGYVQCMPETPPTAIYCEAQSAESWPALKGVLTPQRIARLHSAGYADPGRAPNYFRSYPFDKYSDAVIAAEILGVLHEAYGYSGGAPLNITPE